MFFPLCDLVWIVPIVSSRSLVFCFVYLLLSSCDSFFFLFHFIYLAALGLSCGMWDLLPWLGIESGEHWVLDTGTPGKSPWDSFLILNIVLFSLRSSICFLLGHLSLCIMFIFCFTFVNEYVTSLLKSLSANSTISYLGLSLLTDFSLVWVTFPCFYMSSGFSSNVGHCKCYIIESLDFIVCFLECWILFPQEVNLLA